MYSTRFITALPVVISAALCLSQKVERDQTVVLKEVHFSGDLGDPPPDELREYTEFLTGHPLERKKLLREASSAVGMSLRHRGYLKEQVTAQLRSLKPSPGSEDVEVALELTIKAGKQYRVKELTFVGLSSQLAEPELRQACNIRSGEIADGEQVSSCITNLTTLFRQKGQNVSVVPSMKFDYASPSVSFQFDVEQ